MKGKIEAEMKAALRNFETSGPDSYLQMLQAEALLELLRRTGWKEIVTDADMPDHRQHCLIWIKGAEHATMATCNVDVRRVKYFILANSGIAKRAQEEVTHWMPAPIGPIESNGKVTT